jgi:hypothetical protein
MKAYIATALAAALLPLSVHAQGTVNFATANASQVVRDQATGTAVGAGYTAALYWGVAGATEAQLVQIGASWPVTAGNGFIINGGTRTTGNGTAPGATAAFQVRAWAGSALTYEAAGAAASRGKTVVFANATGDPAPASGPPVPPAAFGAGWNTPLLVSSVVIPEPSTYALAALGVGALLLFRRRK